MISVISVRHERKEFPSVCSATILPSWFHPREFHNFILERYPCDCYGCDIINILKNSKAIKILNSRWVINTSICMDAEVSVFIIGLCVLCIERWCLSAVCKLCCVRNWGIGWGSLIWVLYMLNCK